MAIYYPPPQPQVSSPHVIVSDSAGPPFGMPPSWITTALAAWQPPDPVPAFIRLYQVQGAAPPPPVTTPPQLIYDTHHRAMVLGL